MAKCHSVVHKLIIFPTFLPAADVKKAGSVAHYDFEPSTLKTLEMDQQSIYLLN